MKVLFFLSLSCLASGYVFAQSNANAQIIDNNFREFSRSLNLNGAARSIATLPGFNTPEPTKGSRYFFDNWAKGSITGVNGNVLNNDSLSFYFDKVTHNLYATLDKRAIIEIDHDQVNSFILENNGNDCYFKRVDLIQPGVFFQVLTEDTAKYSLYKLTKTKFVKSDYHTDGLTESGNRYDEYIDESDYYIVFPDHTYQPVFFKKKSIKKVLEKDMAAVNSYFSQHKNEEINGMFLKGLIIYLNR